MFPPECHTGLDGERQPTKCKIAQQHLTFSYHCQKEATKIGLKRQDYRVAYDGSAVWKQMELITISPSTEAVPTMNVSTIVMLVAFITTALVATTLIVVVAVHFRKRPRMTREKQRNNETGREDFIYSADPTPA